MAEAHDPLLPHPTSPEPAPDLPGSYDFSARDLQRFFDAKWRLAECEICQLPANNFHLQSGGGRFSALAALGNGILSGSTMTTLHVALNLICTNCGNMKLILAPTIFRWLRDNPVPGLQAVHRTNQSAHSHAGEFAKSSAKTTQDQQNIAFMTGDVEGIKGYLSQLGYASARSGAPRRDSFEQTPPASIASLGVEQVDYGTQTSPPDVRSDAETPTVQNELRAGFADLRTLVQSTLHEQNETRRLLHAQDERIASQGRSVQTTVLLVAIIIFAVLLATFLADHSNVLAFFDGSLAGNHSGKVH